MNREVNLIKRVRVNGAYRLCPVLQAGNGRVKPDVVWVDGHEERHTEGAYYIEWYEGTRRRRISVGKNAADAAARQDAKRAELNARNHGVPVAQQSGEHRRSTRRLSRNSSTRRS